MSIPKTLSERLQWMADNLPGFREELEMTRQFAKRCAPPACSGAKPGGAQRAAQKTTGYAYTPRVIRG